MTPVPKNLSPQGRLNWRRSIARGMSPYRAAATSGGKPVRFRDGSNATSLSRVTRNGVA
jgi:hypothetical protein